MKQVQQMKIKKSKKKKRSDSTGKEIKDLKKQFHYEKRKLQGLAENLKNKLDSCTFHV